MVLAHTLKFSQRTAIFEKRNAQVRLKWRAGNSLSLSGRQIYEWRWQPELDFQSLLPRMEITET